MSLEVFPDALSARRYSLWGAVVHCQGGIKLCRKEVFLPLQKVLSELFTTIEMHDLTVSFVRLAKRGNKIFIQAWPSREFRQDLRLSLGQAHSEKVASWCGCGVVYPDGRHPGGFDCPEGLVAEIMLR